MGFGMFSQVLSDWRERAEKPAEALEEGIDPGESVVHQLHGSGPLRVESGDETEEVYGDDEDEALVAVTDRRLVFVVETEADPEWFDVSFTEIRSVELTGRVVRPRLEVRVWGDGSYVVHVDRAQGVNTTVTYLEEAHERWKRVGSVLTNAEKATDDLERRVVAGDLRAAFDAREKAEQKLAKARRLLEETSVETAVLKRQVDRVAETRHRTEIRARTSLATRLVTEGDQGTADGEYEAAYRSYWRARDHLENALALARKHDLSEPATIRDDLERIENHLDHLRVRPVGLAKQAHERARTTTDSTEAVETWRAAHEHYRDALEVGWGSDLEFRGEKGAIRDALVRVVNNRMEAYRWHVEELEAEADELRENGELAKAKRHYEAALDTCGEALELAREYDPEARSWVRENRHRVNAKYESVRWELA